MNTRNKLHVLYLCEGSNFAGIESYAINLIRKLNNDDLVYSIAVFYPGHFSMHLRKISSSVIELFGKHNLKSLLSILKFARHQKIDVIHSLDIKGTIIGGLASILLPNVLTISTVHGLPEKPDKGSIRYYLYIKLYLFLLAHVFDGQIFVSSDLKNNFCKKLKLKNNHVVHNGIEIDEITNDRENAKLQCKHTYVIGTVGRLDFIKGHKYLLEAIKILSLERNDFVVQIIGQGPLELDLKKLSIDLGISHRIHFLGFRSDAKKLIGKMDIFVLSSLHEGIPYVVLEAMSSGVPVICTCVGGIGEIINNSQDGILVPPRNSQLLYQAISEMLSNDYLRGRLGSCGKEKIKNNFSANSMAQRTINFYKQLKEMT